MNAIDEGSTIYLSGDINADSIIESFRDILKCKQPKSKKYFLDFKDISFVHPSGLTILVNIIRWLILNECQVYAVNCQKENNPIKYLKGVGFFEAFKPDANKTLQNPDRQTIMPLQLLTDEQSTVWVHWAFPEWLATRCSTTKNEVINSISSCVAELLNNIKDHSRQNISCIFGQHYPNQNDKIELAISDYGIGIPESIRTAYKNLIDDVDCLKEAIKEGISSKSSPRNRGAGLNHIINYITRQIEGSIVIYSGCARLSCKNNPDNIKYINNSFFPGTAIIIEIPAKKVKDLYLSLPRDEKEDLIW